MAPIIILSECQIGTKIGKHDKLSWQFILCSELTVIQERHGSVVLSKQDSNLETFYW